MKLNKIGDILDFYNFDYYYYYYLKVFIIFWLWLNYGHINYTALSVNNHHRNGNCLITKIMNFKSECFMHWLE
jgi:hypothetical protein